jgi:ribosomal protein S12 methylthiotransferase
MKLYLESLGCARNQVDSEVMLGRLADAGWTIGTEPDDADAIVVNTCSFIESAIDESIDTILELAKYKKSGICRRLVVAGCLPERFRGDIISALPEVDCFLGTGAYDAIVEAITEGSTLSACHLPDPNLATSQSMDNRRILSVPGTAYLKISDGCNRRCTYCIIPKLRGDQKSRSLGDIVGEAQNLIRSGVKELVLVAQETTAWGEDLPSSPPFSHLLQALSDISDQTWIRLLYGHPSSVDEETIITVANCANVCSYFDIPVQHAGDRILQKMGRHYRQDDLLKLFEQIRSRVPDVALRTSVMVGFPGETESDFDRLFDFVKTVRFDHLGVFTYSGGDDIPAQTLGDPVPPEVAQERHDRIMSYQQEISGGNLQKYVGKRLNVLVEDIAEENVFTGRTEYQAPEVDGLIYIHTNDASAPGLLNHFVQVRITDALEYDLVGELI